MQDFELTKERVPAEIKLGVVVPTYNEGESIEGLLSTIRKFAPTAVVQVVDDSSKPTTMEAITRYQTQHPQEPVFVVHREQKGGRGSAVLEGLKQLRARGCEICIEMDADFSHPPGQLPELVRELQAKKLDLLIGSRYLEESEIHNWPLSRRIFSRASNWLASLLLRVPIADYTNGLRCYSAPAVDLILKTCGVYGKGFIALSEILVNLYYAPGQKMQIGEVPTRFVNRVRGESSVNHSEISNALLGLLKIYGLKRRLQQQRLGVQARSVEKSV